MEEVEEGDGGAPPGVGWSRSGGLLKIGTEERSWGGGGVKGCKLRPDTQTCNTRTS